MNELNDKRLLVLGGNPWLEAIKAFCDRNGIHIITVGNNPNSNLNIIAEEYYNVDSTDSDAMKRLIEEKNIDGVYMGGTESVIEAACQYINELGLPCYCNKAQWDALQNKKNFKEICIKAGLPVVLKYEVKEDDCSLPTEAFPVITKPADGCGSEGFSVCMDNAELKTGYERAKINSPTGTVITEKFVKNSGVVCFYTISNGTVHFSGLSDKYPAKFAKQGSYVGGLFTYESGYEDEFRGMFEGKIQELIAELGIKEGPLWIEVFRDKDSYYFNEVGFRYGGSVSVYPINYLFGINQVASDIYFALTGKSKIFGHQTMIPESIPSKAHYAVYPIYVSAGRISRICGADELKNDNNIVTVIKKLGVGDTVLDTGSFGQVFALVHFVYDNMTELKKMIDKINKSVFVFNEQNDNMILRMLDKKSLIL